MVINILENLKREKNVGKENIFFIIKSNMKAIGIMEKEMDREFINGLMENVI